MPSDDDLFIGDQLDKPENRMNHVLFGLFINNEYRREILRQLDMSENAIIYKPKDQIWGGTSARPDFAIESYDGRILAYIEVELDKDPAQLDRYRRHAGVPVYSFGREDRDHNITLQTLVKIAEDISEEGPDPQFVLMVRHFAKQVSEASGIRKSPPRGPVKAEMLKTPLGKALTTAGMVNWGEDAPKRGRFYGWTRGPNGLGVGVFSRQSNDKIVSLFYLQAGRPIIHFRSYSRLVEYLPDRRAELDAWADFIELRLGGDTRTIGRRETSPAELNLVEANVVELLDVMLHLQ